MAKGSVTIRRTFDAGETVRLFDRTGDFFDAERVGNYNEVKAAKVDKDSTVAFSGLDVGRPYWAVQTSGRTVHVGVTGKEERVVRKPSPPVTPGSFDPQTLSQVPRHKISTGAHDTRSRVVRDPRGHALPADPFAHASRGLPVKDEKVTGGDEPDPEHVRQEDVPKNQPQMSSTVTGTAEPVRDEPVKQEDSKGPQASDTELGLAAPVDAEGPPKLEDADGPQRVTGDTGVAYGKDELAGAESKKEKRAPKRTKK